MSKESLPKKLEERILSNAFNKAKPDSLDLEASDKAQSSCAIGPLLDDRQQHNCRELDKVFREQSDLMGVPAVEAPKAPILQLASATWARPAEGKATPSRVAASCSGPQKKEHSC